MKWFLKWMLCVLILFVCLAFSRIAAIQAQDSPDQAKAGVFDLGEVVVTVKGDDYPGDHGGNGGQRTNGPDNSQDVPRHSKPCPVSLSQKERGRGLPQRVRGFNQRYVPIFV